MRLDEQAAVAGELSGQVPDALAVHRGLASGGDGRAGGDAVGGEGAGHGGDLGLRDLPVQVGRADAGGHVIAHVRHVGHICGRHVRVWRGVLIGRGVGHVGGVHVAVGGQIRGAVCAHLHVWVDGDEVVIVLAICADTGGEAEREEEQR